ncbi:MAG TPA: PAS domain-containing protein [Gaiellaceae bacterium]|nr:PAS domain-containing protein [Gaiellaceae bacterium]
MPNDASQRLVHRSLIGEAVEAMNGVAVFVWDEHRHYVAVNDAACTMTGLSRSELIGMPVGDRTADRASALMEQAARSEVLSGVMTFSRADGSDLEVNYVTMHTRIANLPFMVSMIWPVSPSQ